MNALDALVPLVDFSKLAGQAQSTPAYRALVVSGTLFAIGLIYKFTLELQRLRRGEPVDWIEPVAQLVGLMFFLFFYPRFVPGAIDFLTHLGVSADADTLADLSHLRALRMQELADQVPSRLETARTLGVLERDSVFLWTRLIHLTIDSAVLTIRSGQTFILAVLVEIGPLLLAISWFGGWFRALAGRWVLAVLEVCSWSWILATLVRLCSPSLRLHYARDSSFAQLPHEFSYSLTSLILVILIPAIARMVMRGASHAWQAGRASAVATAGLGGGSGTMPSAAMASAMVTASASASMAAPLRPLAGAPAPADARMPAGEALVALPTAAAGHPVRSAVSHRPGAGGAARSPDDGRAESPAADGGSRAAAPLRPHADQRGFSS